MNQNLGPFQFENSLLWNTILENLSAAVEVETSQAIAGETQGEERIHQCGRAAGLTDFGAHLVHLRETALNDMN